jgi:hypothetical protein
MPVSPSHERFPSVLSAVMAWFHERAEGAHPEPPPATPVDVEPAARPSAASLDAADSARLICGVALLFRCMPMLQIDPDELARDDPLLFRELQGLCSLCACKAECANDLARKFDEISLEKWSDYCPNAATLTMLGAVQNCAVAAQYMKKPRATGVLEES